MSVVHGRELKKPLREHCDVVIVGSGAGGMTMAAHLAEAGLDVIVLEEGAYYRSQDISAFKPSESLRRLFREAGMLAALGRGQTPTISLTVGRAVGGSSLLTGGVCFRIPSEVHHGWEHDLGLTGLSERSLQDEYADVERRMAVTRVPERLRSESTRRFVRGAELMGVKMHALHRNTGDDCVGSAMCNFGCPVGAKRSVDISYMPSALRHGTRIVSDALVQEIVTKGGRAVGVAGRLLGGRFGKPGLSFRVTARAVVLSCGTIHTPMLLQGQGLRSHGLGRYITVHPCVRMMARFKEPLNGWDGALQSAHTDHFDGEGIKFTSVYTSVNVLAASLPGAGPELMRRVRDMPHYAVFGGMVHDGGGGVVSRGLGREPVLSYEMAPRDLVQLRRAMAILAEMALLGGAEEVLPPIFGAEPVRTKAQVRALMDAPLDARRIECLAFHPLGSARAANDPRRGVVNQDGASYELPGLYIADGSILPTSIGVNSQVPIMTLATRVAWRLRDALLP